MNTYVVIGLCSVAGFISVLAWLHGYVYGSLVRSREHLAWLQSVLPEEKEQL